MERKRSIRRRQKPPFERVKDHCRAFTAFMFSNVGITFLVVLYIIGGECGQIFFFLLSFWDWSRVELKIFILTFLKRFKSNWVKIIFRLILKSSWDDKKIPSDRFLKFWIYLTLNRNIPWRSPGLSLVELNWKNIFFYSTEI